MDDEDAKHRRRSKVTIYLHFVWTTKYRADFLTNKYERSIHRCIVSEAQSLGCQVLAIGGMPDHVHFVVRMPGKLSASDLVRRVKGSASVLYNSLRPEYSDVFRWQDGYGCFSLWEAQIENVVSYVQHQKEHHENGNLYDVLEEFDEPSPINDAPIPYEFPTD